MHFLGSVPLNRAIFSFCCSLVIFYPQRFGQKFGKVDDGERPVGIFLQIVQTQRTCRNEHFRALFLRAIHDHITTAFRKFLVFQRNVGPATFVSERIMDAKALTTKDAFYPFLYFPMVTFNNKHFLASVFSNELYQYEKGKAFPVYHVDASATIPDEAFLDEHKDLDFFELLKIMSQQNISMGITALEASSDYLFALIDNRRTLVWDGEKGILVSTTYNSDLNLYSSLLTGGSSDEHVGYLSAEFFCDKKEDSAGSKTLSELADSLSEDDNPVLFQYHFKKGAVKSLMEKYKL